MNKNKIYFPTNCNKAIQITDTFKLIDSAYCDIDYHYIIDESCEVCDGDGNVIGTAENGDLVIKTYNTEFLRENNRPYLYIVKAPEFTNMIREREAWKNARKNCDTKTDGEVCAPNAN